MVTGGVTCGHSSLLIDVIVVVVPFGSQLMVGTQAVDVQGVIITMAISVATVQYSAHIEAVCLTMHEAVDVGLLSPCLSPSLSPP